MKINYKETLKLVKSCFKCNFCGARYKKEITLKKHLNRKHDNKKFKVCHKVFKASMEVLEHVPKEHSKNVVANISVKEKDKLTEQDKVDISDCEDNIDKHIQFNCVKSTKFVVLDDKFNNDLKNTRCASFAPHLLLMIIKRKGLVQHKGLHCNCSVELRRQSTTV